MLERLGMTRDVLDRARRSRDARFDGKFFIAVTSTRIYCRSICPAKTSKDSNVRYYATAAEAAEAGFRPCRRCRPETAPGSPAWLGTSAVVRRALRMIQDGALDNSSVENLAGRLGVGARHLGRLFMRHVGVSPLAVAQTRRLHFAKQLLDETELPITQVALASGFGSVRRFNDAFKGTYHRSPREIRKAGGKRRNEAQIRLRLTYRPPYDWRQMNQFLANRAIRGVETVEPGIYRRTVRVGRGHAIVQVSPIPAADALELTIQGGQSSELLAFASSVRRMFDLSADPARITEVLQRDPLLKPAVAARPGLRIAGNWDPFESAVRALASRGRALQSARELISRLVECTGQRIADETEGLCWLFPTPESIAQTSLENIDLPRDLANTLRSFSGSVCNRAIGATLAAEAVLEALADLPGAGAWTAGCVLLFGLGDPDAFPSGDPVLRRKASSDKASLTEVELDARAEVWRPFRGYAALHLWEGTSAG